MYLPVYDMGGCALLGAAIEPKPAASRGRQMKADHFGGPNDVATFADVRALIRDPPEGPTASD